MGAPSTLSNADDDMKKKPQNSNDSLSTYLSLVQQYLSVFMVDNATFLAERCLAEYPNNHEAIYMLALCYYRAGSTKRARQLLENPATSSMRYLSAQCSYDLKDYARAEDVLLKESRATFLRIAGRGVVSMDDWILQTTVSRESSKALMTMKKKFAPPLTHNFYF